jgi:hypothetical protein
LATIDCSDNLQVRPATSQRQRVRGEWSESASASQHATTLAHRSSVGTAGAFGAPAGIFSREKVSVSYRSQLGSASVGSGGEASESIASREEQSFVGVLGFALTRLQNLTSVVWLKKRASVAAEAADGA